MIVLYYFLTVLKIYVNVLYRTKVKVDILVFETEVVEK